MQKSRICKIKINAFTSFRHIVCLAGFVINQQRNRGLLVEPAWLLRRREIQRDTVFIVNRKMIRKMASQRCLPDTSTSGLDEPHLQSLNQAESSQYLISSNEIQCEIQWSHTSPDSEKHLNYLLAKISYIWFTDNKPVHSKKTFKTCIRRK